MLVSSFLYILTEDHGAHGASGTAIYRQKNYHLHLNLCYYPGIVGCILNIAGFSCTGKEEDFYRADRVSCKHKRKTEEAEIAENIN